MLADRMVLLDHLTRGRVMLGCGPGQLTSDAHMLGFRRRPATADGAVSGRDHAPAARRDGHHAYRRLPPAGCAAATGAPHRSLFRRRWPPRSPRPVRAARAGTASGCCPSRPPPDRAWTCWPSTGRRGKRSPPSTGHVADRSGWRLVGPMHLAETREQAERDVEYGIVEFSQYFSHLLPGGPVQGRHQIEEILANNNQSGFAVIGTPADAIAPRSRSSVEASNGGSARSCCWTTTGPAGGPRCAATNCSPSTSCRTSPGQLAGPAASCDWVRAQRDHVHAERAAHPSERRSRTTRRSGPDVPDQTSTVGTIIGWRR